MGCGTSNNNINCNICSLVATAHLKYQSVFQYMELVVYMQRLWETGSDTMARVPKNNVHLWKPIPLL